MYDVKWVAQELYWWDGSVQDSEDNHITECRLNLKGPMEYRYYYLPTSLSLGIIIYRILPIDEAFKRVSCYTETVFATTWDS